ncbi:MAG: nuclear transport factor 2 family protein [Dehalococcoidia bacterium]|nr:nuclear transport factor 2 family protein [Dehalococcoidia bacterium]MYA53219.1 nuclear transport factor 2 family protein [Dehalococcoidia bacterium]
MSDDALRTLLDRQAISDTVLRYATGIDMRDWEAYRSCFTDEVEIDFTSWSGGEPSTMRGDDWTAGVRAGLSGLQATQHISTNHVITFAEGGDEATCVSYMQAQHYLPNDEGDNTLTLGGYYTNTLVRTEDGWRIRRCQLNVTWTTGNKHIFVLARERWAAMEAAGESQGG